MTNKQPPENLKDSSAGSQRVRILAWLQQVGSIDTPTARSELSVMHPAARIQELRERGHNIKTHRETIEDAQGCKHQGVATYYLSAEVDE